MFHSVGDATTQVNWAAPNTSFAERDRDSRLRGYDDFARVVEVVDPADGSRSRTIRRNLVALLPLWKHRDDPQHPDVRALLDRPRDVKLTLDARLQLRVAALLKAHVTAARQQHGAAVVVDATSGDLLAAVSYPWPDEAAARSARGAAADDAATQPLLDRARYGVYPPGSTFKLVTATAVLRSAPGLADEPLICQRLEAGRVGNVVPGWRRPVRDDVTDRMPHGSVVLDRGLVVSCNAYFAQLGARLGGAPLRETARLFDIAVTRGDAPERLRDTLPFAAYGQGEVLATPYRMARVAAAIAADGVLAPGRTFLEDETPGVPAPVRVLEVGAARRLAGAMREVVVSGTGRGLLAHPEQVAGKTGTAEVEGAPSHSWFVGFAPYGAEGSRRIAFAVIVEHGGYGGRAAAPLAGEIVTLARELGLLGPVSAVGGRRGASTR
jgi:cell division protein FtsI/penicillin-binding protein 2